MASALLKQLLEAGVHFGHQTKRWNPKMKRYIFGSRSKIYIIDLEKTEQQLAKACEFLKGIAARGGLILMVGTKKQARPVVQFEAERCGMPYVTQRWVGGVLTNFATAKQSLARLKQLRAQKADGYFERISKKDAKRFQHQLDKLEIQYGNLDQLERPPACLFVIDPKREANAIHEANRLDIPIVAICDTNADPDVITYPVPGNDDAIRAIRLLTQLITDSIVAGRREAGLPLPGDEPAAETAIEAPASVAAESEGP